MGTAVLKSEGAEHSSVGLAGTGDLVRDSTGAGVAGFTYMIGTCSSTRAEHLGLFTGFNLVWNLGLSLKSIPNQWLSLLRRVVMSKSQTHPLYIVSATC